VGVCMRRPVQRWESVKAAERRIALASVRLNHWPYDESMVRYALKESREAVAFLERALEPRRRRSLTSDSPHSHEAGRSEP
jgi:succinate dehydrogenase/fumarate reductase flavoprotein subunit